MAKLNQMAEEILEYIRQAVNEGPPPSVREICQALHIKSTSTVHRYLKLLEQEGYIDRISGINRNIKVNGQHTGVPILGAVTAGIPILAEEQIQGYVELPASLRGSQTKNLFALRVIGDSMIGAGILEGDMIIVDKEAYVKNSDIVVALIEDEATVKRFFQEKDHVRLQPENDRYDPILVTEVSVLGKVVTLVRNY